MIVVLLLGACGGGDAEIANQTPGEGVTVTQARADWDSSYFQAAIFRQLLEELGYVVTDPAENEMSPADFYPSLSTGDLDFWSEGWFPNHDGLLTDSVAVVGLSVPGGALQGFLVDKATADEYDIEYLGDIAASDELIALFDYDGNGLADLVGCNEGWGCHTVIAETIIANGWETKIEQIVGEYSELWAETVVRHQAGSPVLAYTWAPTAYIIELVPGQDVVWLSVLNPIPTQAGTTALPPSQCPGQPCQMGFSSADIRVVANNEFLDANPPARRLFELVGLQMTDIAIQNFKMLQGENSEDEIRGHAAEWIEKNRIVIDTWLDAARQAGAVE